MRSTRRRRAQASDAGAQDQRAGFAGSLWSRTVAAVADEFPDVEVGYQHIDAATIHMVNDPGRFDVIVTDNLFGDIITDLARRCAVVSAWRRAATSTPPDEPACSNRCTAARPTSPARARPTRPRPSCRVALLLDHLGETERGKRIQDAVATDLSQRGGGGGTTSEIGERIAAAL